MPDFAYVSRMQLNWSFHVLGLRREIWPSLEEKSDVGLRAGLEFGDKSLQLSVCAEFSAPRWATRAELCCSLVQMVPRPCNSHNIPINSKRRCCSCQPPTFKDRSETALLRLAKCSKKKKGDFFFPLSPVGFCFVFFPFPSVFWASLARFHFAFFFLWSCLDQRNAMYLCFGVEAELSCNCLNLEVELYLKKNEAINNNLRTGNTVAVKYRFNF